MSILHVTAENIHSIKSAEQLVDLLRQLLLAEARSSGVARRGVSVPAQITVSDEGEDGRVEWQNGPDETQYFPARITMFQSKATRMPRSKCLKEVKDRQGQLKDAIRETLESNGAYIVFSTDKCVEQGRYGRQARIQGIREGIAEATVGQFPDAKVDFYDANKISAWVNDHPSVGVWALSNLFNRPVSFLQSWESWSHNTDLKAQKYDFVAGTSSDGSVDLKTVMSDVRAHLSNPRSVARIVGLSGLGKTRLALEMFRPPGDSSDSVSAAEAASVVYTVADLQSQLLSLFHDLRSEGNEAIFVVDDCDINLHRSLAQIVQHPDSSLSLLTLDYDPTSVDDGLRYVELKRLNDEIIKAILTQAYPQLSDPEVNRICEFAQGFPMMAVLLGDAALAEEERVATLRNDVILTRLVWGRNTIDETGQRVLAACSLFDTLGVDGRAKPELESVAQHICDISWQRCYEWIQRFQNRQLVQRRGDFIQVLPKPLALRLAADRWEQVHPDSAKDWFGGLLPDRLRSALCDQLALLDFHPGAQALVDKLCGLKGPFGSPEVLNTESGSRCFRSLVEVNPEAAMRALTRAFGAWSTEQLVGIGPGRRNLVWSLEKLSFRRNTFPEAARLLLSFAAAENESWANNATGQFVQLYQLYLSGSEVTGDEKLAIIDEVMVCGDSKKIAVGIKALSNGLTTGHFSRTGGAETQGTSKPLEDWRPTGQEVQSYYHAILSRLAMIASGRGEFAKLAREEIPGHLRGLIGAGLIDAIESVIAAITITHGTYWPEVVESISDTLEFDRDRLPSDVVQKVETLYGRLLPQSLDERLRFYVTELPWGFLRRGDAKGDEERVIRNLADECAKVPDFVLEKLPDLLSGSQRQFFPFGHRLGEVFAVPERFIDFALSILISHERPDTNSALLGAFLNGLQSRRPDLVERALDTVATAEPLQKHLVDLTRLITIQPADTRRIISALKAKHISPSAVRSLSYGSVLSKVPAAEVVALVDTLLEWGDEAAWVALEIAFFYVHGNSDQWISLRPVVVRILLALDLRTEVNRTNLDTHHLEVFAKKILEGGPDSDKIAAHLAEEVVRLCQLRRFPHSLDHMIETVVRAVLERYPLVGLTVFEGAIATAEPLVRFHLESALGSGYSRHNKQGGPIFTLSEGVLLDWCRRQPDSAPAFLARTAPLLAKESNGTNKWTSLITALIDEFGGQKGVLDALSSNIGTFFHSGSLVTYYRQYERPLAMLSPHRHKAVRAFATRELEYIRDQIRQETKRDEEHEFGIF